LKKKLTSCFTPGISHQPAYSKRSKTGLSGACKGKRENLPLDGLIHPEISNNELTVSPGSEGRAYQEMWQKDSARLQMKKELLELPE